jgi:hypothetical protein
LSVGIQVLVAMGPGLYSQICWRERWATSTSAFIADTSPTLAAKGARGAYRVLVKVPTLSTAGTMRFGNQPHRRGVHRRIEIDCALFDCDAVGGARRSVGTTGQAVPG